MYVLGQTDVDRLDIYYDRRTGLPWPAADPTDSEDCGKIVWITRQLRSSDRHSLSQREDDDDSEMNEVDHQMLVNVTVAVEGLSVLMPPVNGAKKGKVVKLETVTSENLVRVTGWIRGAAWKRVMELMEATGKALGESETPSVSPSKPTETTP